MLVFTRQIYTCLKSIIETLEKDVVPASLLLTFNIFHIFSGVSFVVFEHVFVFWVIIRNMPKVNKKIHAVIRIICIFDLSEP